jgi:hypothetical protein
MALIPSGVLVHPDGFFSQNKSFLKTIKPEEHPEPLKL